MYMIDKYGAMKIARVLAQNADLAVVFEDTANPRTDGQKLYVENPKDFWGEAHWTIWWGNLYHEIGHNHPNCRDAFKLIERKKINMRSFFGFGLNCIEDNRMERNDFDLYKGRLIAISRSHSLLVRRQIAGSSFGQKLDLPMQAIYAMVIWDTWERMSWMGGMQGLWKQMYDQCPPQAQEWADALIASRFVLKDLTDAESVYYMWKEIIDEIFKFDSDAEEKKSQDRKPKNPCSGEQEGSGAGESKAEGSGKAEGSSEAVGAGKGADRGSDATVDYSDMLKHKHIEGGGESYGNLTIKYTDDDISYGATFVSKPVQVEDYVHQARTLKGGHYRSSVEALITKGNSLASTVRRLLQIRSRDRYQYGKKKGRLHGSSLHRLGLKNGGAACERVFKQKRVNECLDCSVTILGDSSGSMGTTKYTSMCASMILLQQALQPLKVPYELLSFTDQRCSRINIFKGFKDHVTEKKLIDSLMDAGTHKHNNADGEAIMWAYSRLLEQKTARRVLVVLSDGSPASSRTGNAAYHTKKVIEGIEKQGAVEIYGVGIEDDNVKKYYNNCQVIENSSGLEKALLDLIKTRIIK